MRLVILADANSTIGAGHVMRCAALAEAWIEQCLGAVAHAGVVSIPFAARRLESLGIAKTDNWETDSVGGILVVDSYDEQVRHAARARPGRFTVLVDDVGPVVEQYDAIWNPNAYSSAHLYPQFVGTLIAQRVPIRRELPGWSGTSSDIALSLGGGLPAAWIVRAIDQWAASHSVRIVTARASWVPNHWCAVDSVNPWEAFSRCASMLTAGGSTVWEASYVGIPTCVMLCAPNQRLICLWAAANGAPLVDIALASGSASELQSLLAEHVPRAALLPRVERATAEVARALFRAASTMNSANGAAGL